MKLTLATATAILAFCANAAPIMKTREAIAAEDKDTKQETLSSE